MKAYRKEIIDNVVSYIARSYYSAKGRYITQTLLFKILALLDFRALKQNGRPCVEFTYTARNLGPVPEELYKGDLSLYESFKTKDKKYKDKNGSERTTRYYVSVKEPDLDYIAPSEKKILDDILSNVITKNISGTQAAEITHKEILAWKIAYERKPNSKINYADEFIGLDSKSEAEMTIPELNFIKYRDFANA